MLQKLQMFSRDGAAQEGASYRGSDSYAEPDDRRARRFPGFIRAFAHPEYFAPAAGLLILALLAHPAGGLTILLALIGVGILPWAIYRTSRHATSLLIVFVLIEAATASSFVAANSDTPIGALIRYPLEFLFVLPFVSALWKSGILRKGGFRDCAIYLLWALLSVSYSILPTVSLARAFAAILPFCGFCVIATEVRTGKDARRAMGVLLAGCGIVVAANFLAMFIPACTPWQIDTDTEMLRFTGFLAEPNEVGNLMLATVGAGFCYWPVASGWKKVSTGVVMTGALIQAVMADSRSPIVGIAIGCAVYLVWKYRSKGAIAIAALYIVFYASTLVIPGMHAYMDRGDVASFTGRQVAWDFAVSSIKKSPIVGYGYEVEGQILSSQYFPGWDEVWNLGYQSSLHEGFVSRAISLGIPALLFWLFLTLRPMIVCFFRDHDPWELKSIAPLAMLPVLILNFTESVVDFRSFAGLMLALSWAVLESERLFVLEQAAKRASAVEESKTPIVRALQRAYVS
jgi:O-antigen ligase